MSIRTAVKALAVLVVGRDVGRDLVADGAGHRLVGHVLRCNVQPSVGYQRERGVAIEEHTRLAVRSVFDWQEFDAGRDNKEGIYATVSQE